MLLCDDMVDFEFQFVTFFRYLAIFTAIVGPSPHLFCDSQWYLHDLEEVALLSTRRALDFRIETKCPTRS